MTPEPPEFAQADIFIQWKNVDGCLDFHCSCNPGQRYTGHFDGEGMDKLECPRCGARYVLPVGFTLRAINETGFQDYFNQVELDEDEDQ